MKFLDEFNLAHIQKAEGIYPKLTVAPPLRGCQSNFPTCFSNFPIDSNSPIINFQTIFESPTIYSHLPDYLELKSIQPVHQAFQTMSNEETIGV